MSMRSKGLALLGGSESGKTTYLGALSDALEDERIDGLRMDGMPEDARALEQLQEPLLQGRYPQRTKAERHQLELPLVVLPPDPDESAHMAQPRAPLVDEPLHFTLRVGDYDGEEVERLFRDRTRGWSAEWRARAQADGLLLFLRSESIRPIPRAASREVPSEAERWRLLAGLELKGSSPAPAVSGFSSDSRGPESVFGPGLAEEEVPAPPPAQPDDPVVIPTVLAVVELLQFIRQVRGLAPGEQPARGSFRVALLVAAWDEVDAGWHRRGAAAYLGETLPLLEDFLRSNFHPDDVFRFGLSSTGGDLKDPVYKSRYLEEPGGFITWSDATRQIVRSSDLSIPLKWALFGDRALVPESSM
jgi:hypothetical protein